MTRNRRDYLTTLGAATVSIAGCLGLSENGSSGSQTAFSDIYVDGVSLVVELTEGASLDRVNVIAPDGSMFAGRVVGQGVTKLEFELGVKYIPGEHRVVGVADDETVAESTNDIVPDIEVTEFGVGANHLDRMPDSLGHTKDDEALVSFKNAGSGPEAVEKLLLLGYLPNPTTDLKTKGTPDYISGIFDAEEGAGDLERLMLRPGEERTVFTSSLPFSFQGEGVDCKNQKQNGNFDLIAKTEVSTSDFSNEYNIEYTADKEYNGCDVLVFERES